MKMFNIAVIGGAGHIGLPLSVFLQNKGNNVLVVDPNTNYVSKAVKGTPPFVEKNFKPNLDQALFKGLKFTDKIENIKSKEYIITYQGKTFEIKNLRAFAIKNKLDQGNMCKVAQKKLDHYKGYIVSYK